MADLRPVPFTTLLRRMRREVEVSQAIFDLPVRKWFVPDPELDFSASHFDRRAATPVGPAAGPHTQLAQNIVLAWLAGSRIIELKTVQVNDSLTIPRPCIHAPNIGFNVEWSQELSVEHSAMEYAKAAFLIEILKATRGFGVFPSSHGCETIFDISVGYDLEGIRSEKVDGFLDALGNPRPLFDALRGSLPGDLAEFRDTPLPDVISDCVTLSTFHGCPADQIEAIGRHLIEARGLHTIIKLNPTLLGYERVHELLVDQLGYEHLRLRREAFEQDLQYEDGLAILRNLRALAAEHDSTIGAKFTNTLVVANDAAVFPSQSEPYMYVSGPPLHVISMSLMQLFRDDLGFEIPVSFSAGVDARNFAGAVACGMVPVTTCTDLLRQGGYGRLPAYLRSLASAMRKSGVSSREAYVLAAGGNAERAVADTFSTLDRAGTWEAEAGQLTRCARDEPDRLPDALRDAARRGGLDGDAVVSHALRVAGRLNGGEVVAALPHHARYHADRNSKTPRRIESTLALHDCINCDLCITACPNDAIFAYTVDPVEVATDRVESDGSGGIERVPGTGFAVADPHQLAVLEGACNECSNCEVYCPEEGAPFLAKERVFLDAADFHELTTLDGFCRDGGALLARVDGREFRVTVDRAANRADVSGAGARLQIAWQPLVVLGGTIEPWAELDTAVLWRAKIVWDTIFEARSPNMVQSDR